MRYERSGLLAATAALLVLTCGQLAHAQDPAAIRDVDQGGDKKRRPIVFVHGAQGSGDQFERQAMHFTSNGYPASWIVTFDYSTAAGGIGGGRGAAPGAARGAAPAGGTAGRGGLTGRGSLIGRGARGDAQGGGAAAGRGRGAAADGAPARGPQGPPAPSPVLDALDKVIDDLRARTGHEKIDLAGHSLGTAQTSSYLRDPKRAAKVAHWASIGGGAANNPNGVPSIAVSGLGDNGRGPSASDGGVTASMPDYQDHVMVCTSDESFAAIYTFFNGGEAPKTMKIEFEAEPLVGGFVKSYVNNVPVKGAKVEVWEVARSTGQRTKNRPLITLAADAAGKWGPFRAKPGQHYEFVVYDNALAKPRHVYREPFSHTNLLVYFRNSAIAENYTPTPFDRVPQFLTDKTSLFNVRHQNGSLLPGVMSLKVNGTELIVDPILPKPAGARQNPTVALYLADGNGNGKSDLTRISDPAFSGPFIASADVYIPAEKGSVQFKLNNRVLNVPAWKGSETGHINVVFDDFK